MATGKSSKTSKRKARDSDREYAAELVRRYRERDPYRVEINGRTIELYVDGDELARSLQAFAEDGTWERPAELPADFRRESLRWNFNKLREQHGCTAGQAIDIIIEVWKVSEQTVRNAVYGRKTGKT